MQRNITQRIIMQWNIMQMNNIQRNIMHMNIMQRNVMQKYQAKSIMQINIMHTNILQREGKGKEGSAQEAVLPLRLSIGGPSFSSAHYNTLAAKCTKQHTLAAQHSKQHILAANRTKQQSTLLCCSSTAAAIFSHTLDLLCLLSSAQSLSIFVKPFNSVQPGTIKQSKT